VDASDASALKNLLYGQFARVAKALASPVRLELLENLAQGERSVDELSRATGIPMANTSHHLQILRDGGLVKSYRDGAQIIYSLSEEHAVIRLVAGIREVGEAQLAEVKHVVRETLGQLDNTEAISAAEVRQRARKGEVLLLDVRPHHEFQSGHIKGAINLPLEELRPRLTELPHDREIVAYCRGPYCLLAYDAVATLRQHGLRARRLNCGFPEWKLAQFPVTAEQRARTHDRARSDRL